MPCAKRPTGSPHDSGRMPRTTGVAMIRAFRRAGWTHTRTTGDHVMMHSPSGPEQIQIQYHNRDLTVGIIAQIVRRSGLTKADLRRML